MKTMQIFRKTFATMKALSQLSNKKKILFIYQIKVNKK